LRICILSQFLAHQKISSSPTEKKTPRNPHSIACIGPNSPLASSLSFFFRLRRMDRSFLLGKKNEGMLVCIVHGATVLISRHEKLNSVVLDFFAP
jgi:hypothetical protein